MKQPTRTIVWLLLAATISIDAVAIAWLAEHPDLRTAGNLFDALSFSQLSVACIWGVFSPKSRAWKTAVVAATTLIAAAVTAKLFEFRIWETIALFGAYATLLVILLWTIKHSALWPIPPTDNSSVWQFSMGQLLLLMTVVAVLLSLFRASELRDLGEAIASDLVTNSALVAALVVIWAKPWGLRLRLATSLSVAGLFGLLSWGYVWLRADPLPGVAAGDILLCLVNGIVQTLVIASWMELAQLIPRVHVDRVATDGAQPN